MNVMKVRNSNIARPAASRLKSRAGEIRNKVQNLNDQIFKTFWSLKHSVIRICFGFRASDFLILFIFLMISPGYVWASSSAGEVNAANRLFKQGKYDQSLSHYQKALEKDVDSPLVHYNLGTALYKKGDYPPAVEHLRKAAASAGQAAGSKLKQLTTQPLYNLGNALYKLGMSKKNTDIDGAMADLGQSLANYEQVINMDAKDQDVRYNYRFVQKELERLKKKQMQQKQDQGKQGRSGQQQPAQDKQSQAKENKQNKSSEQSKGQEEKQQEQTQKQQNKQQHGKEQSAREQGNQDQKQQQQAQAQGDELSYKEAKDILEDYQRNEEPKGLLNFIPKDKSEKPVAKDW